MFSGNLMAIKNGTGSTITYGGVTYASGTSVPLGNLVQYEVQFSKLWSSDTGRSMTGENKGTLVGIFPKIIIKTGRLDESDTAGFLALVNQATTNITYFDAEKKAVVTASFYFNDADINLLTKTRMISEGVEIHAIANKRRT